MRVKTVDAELYLLIRDIWEQETFLRGDESRSREAMERILMDDPKTYWYHGPSKDTFMYLSDVEPEKWARLHFVNVANWDAYKDRRKALRILKEMVKDFDLLLLRVLVPAPVSRWPSLLRHLGFFYEGRLRKRLFYNGEWVDAETYSILAEEIEGKVEKRKRKRRSRRPGEKVGENSKKG